MFSSTEVKLMETKLLSQIGQANAFLQKARDWFEKDKLEKMALVAKLLGTMQVRMVMLVHSFQNKFKTRLQFKSLEEICQQLAASVKHAGGNLKDCPWKRLQAKPAASAQPVRSAHITVNQDNFLDIVQLKDFGMELGTRVQAKNGKGLSDLAKCYHIAKMQEGKATLIAADGTTKTLTPGELVDTLDVRQKEGDIIVRSSELTAIENHTGSRLDFITTYTKLILTLSSVSAASAQYASRL